MGEQPQQVEHQWTSYNSGDHTRVAQDHAEAADHALQKLSTSDIASIPDERAHRYRLEFHLAMAQIHATLAQTASTKEMNDALISGYVTIRSGIGE